MKRRCTSLAKQSIELLTGYRIRYHLPPWEGRNFLLTFDDGPVDSTQCVLYLLERYNQKALFFMLADNVRRLPHVAREVLNRGHLIGSHGLFHNSLRDLSSADFMRQVKESFEIVEDVTGHQSSYFRPPPRRDRTDKGLTPLAGW